MLIVYIYIYCALPTTQNVLLAALTIFCIGPNPIPTVLGGLHSTAKWLLTCAFPVTHGMASTGAQDRLSGPPRVATAPFHTVQDTGRNATAWSLVPVNARKRANPATPKPRGRAFTFVYTAF